MVQARGGFNNVSIETHETHETNEVIGEPRLGRSVSIDQAASLLTVSRRTIYNRIRDGRLQTIRTIGGSQRVLVESLVELGFRPQAFPASASQASFTPRPLSR
jgi:excisionase family DNA binding protein